MTTYVLVANAGEACLYTIDNLRTDNLELLKKFDHPESRQKWSDSVSDKRGRYQTDHAARCSYEDKFDPKDMEADSFARELFDEMKGERIVGHGFTELSMGMSSDYEIAVEEGTTLLRIGSAIFSG